MTVSVNIKPELEARLVARAQSIGQSLEGFIELILEEQTTIAEMNSPRVLSCPEKAEAFRAWARSFPAALPVLSLDSISRESIYPRD